MSIAPPPPDAPWALVIAHDPREADELAGLIARHRSVRCATRIAEVTGRFFDRAKESPTVPEASDPALAARLWAFSEALVGARADG